MSFMSHACHEQCFYDRLLCILFEDKKKNKGSNFTVYFIYFNSSFSTKRSTFAADKT